MKAQTLSDWIKQLGLTKVRAAKALGISRSALDDYLSGKYPIPKAVALACVALAIASGHMRFLQFLDPPDLP